MKNDPTRKSTVQAWKASGQWSIGSNWSGTAMIYTASGLGSFALSGDYEVNYELESDPEDLRAARRFETSQGVAIGPIPDDKLGDELVVIFGAKLTAAKAVKTLNALVGRIRDEGLILGRVGTGDFVYESTNRAQC